MAHGDAALAAGMDILTGNEDRREGWDEINKTRDYLAARSSDVTPVEKGGTGASTAAGARDALDVPERNGLGFLKAIAQLSDHDIGIYRNDAAQRTVVRVAHGGTSFDEAIATEPAIAGKVNRGGDTFTGDVFFPTSSPATSGYTVAYINSDGRLSRGASSERYKENITPVDPAALGDIFPDLYQYQMRQGDEQWKYGWIAERLTEHPDLEPFVVYGFEGAVESIDFIALLIAQNAQLHQALDLLTQRIADLEVI